MSLQPGTRLGNYEVLSDLGRGGMGEVYKARDLKLGREVAIKVLPQEMASDSQRLRRFEQEARAASALNHPNIVTIYEIGEHEGAPYIAMEYVVGKTLRELGARGPLPNDKLVRYGMQIAEGLAKAHQAGIVHRDLKPENIIISEDGYVKILDFGLAKLMRFDDVGSDVATMEKESTTPGTILGTVSYMSPEQAKGQPTDFRSDQFSFGAVLYEMATGKPAFRRKSGAETLSAVLRDEPPMNETAPEVRDVVRRCLNKRPEERFPSTASLVESLRSPGESMQETTPGRSIAVLPFTNLSADPADEYFADGLTDEIITDLSRVRELQVASGPSAFRFKGTDKSTRDIAAELNVRYILVGKVRKAGQNIRMTAQLVDAETDRTLWADKYSGDLRDVFEAQEKVSQAIARALQVQLTGGERPQNSEAVVAYLKGRHFFRQATAEGFEQALDYFRRATESDPDYAPAYAGIASTLMWKSAAWQAMPAREAMPKARAAAERALELDPNLAEAHVAMGVVATYADWNTSLADEHFGDALRLSPNEANTHYWYTHPLIFLSTRFQEALEHIQRATELSPVDPWIRSWHGLVHYWSRDYESAIEDARTLVTLEPLWGFGHYLLGNFLATAGNVVEARACHHRAIELGGRNVAYIAWLGAAHALAGDRRQAEECFRELESHRKRGADVNSWKLVIQSSLGHAGAVMQLLEEAFEERSASLVFHLTHPLVDCVRDDPRFADLLRRMKLDHLIDYRPEPPWRPDPSWREV